MTLTPQREIKFRVWVPPLTADGVVVAGYMTYDLLHEKYFATRTESREVPNWIGKEHVALGSFEVNAILAEYGDQIMQYTGLNDKNGKEIYEGDVVRVVYDGSLKYTDEDVEVCKVIWGANEEDEYYPAFDLEGNKMETNALSMAKNNGDIEIIGNIYENPELLTTNEK